MPNIKSAKKRVLVTLAKTNRNKSQNTALKTSIKKAHAAVAANAEDKDAVIKATMKKVDQAVTKGLIHKNNGARKKAALAKLVKEV
ncbi:MAG: 30S ribosomal protein S20 [Clostridiales bacterium]|nr:30S ribosomal protein S20 [Clostridiales bacterium]